MGHSAHAQVDDRQRIAKGQLGVAHHTQSNDQSTQNVGEVR